MISLVQDLDIREQQISQNESLYKKITCLYCLMSNNSLIFPLGASKFRSSGLRAIIFDIIDTLLGGYDFNTAARCIEVFSVIHHVFHHVIHHHRSI